MSMQTVPTNLSRAATFQCQAQPICLQTPISKVNRYLIGWKIYLLNPMGHGVLVNSMLDALPTYAISALQLPQGAIDSIDAQCRMFLWTSKDKSNGARCLVAWDTCCQSKSHGGIELSNLKVQNQCLLLKLLHRIHTLGDSSWVPWVHAHIDLVSMQGEVVGLKFEVCCSSIMHSPPLCLKMVAQPPSRTTFGLWPAVSQTHT
jgi:hypothetical protein